MTRTSSGRMGTLKNRSDARLFVIKQHLDRKPLLEGMASALDLFGAFARGDSRRRGERADFDALRADYLALAGDFWRSVEQFERETPELPEEYRQFDSGSIKQGV